MPEQSNPCSTDLTELAVFRQVGLIHEIGSLRTAQGTGIQCTKVQGQLQSPIVP